MSRIVTGHEPSSGATPERRGFAKGAAVGIVTFLLLLLGGIAVLLLGVVVPALFAVGVPMLILALVWLRGFFIIQPNQAEVLVLFGKYKGTVKGDGWYWTNPLMTKRKVSLRIHNFNTDTLKVNDADGNPIEIGAVVVWRVVDTGRAVFDVERYVEFVQVQAETAVRHLASVHPYDAGSSKKTSLRGDAEAVAGALSDHLQQRLALGGIEVLEARLSHLAYSHEVASAMLQRQQAAAIIAARELIAVGAVGIVEDVVKALHAKGLKLTAEQRTDLMGRLLVVLTSDRGTQPVMPVGNA